MPFRYIASTRFAHMQAAVAAGETLAEQHAAGQGPIQPKGPTKESDPSKTSHSAREIPQVAKAQAKGAIAFQMSQRLRAARLDTQSPKKRTDDKNVSQSNDSAASARRPSQLKHAE